MRDTARWPPRPAAGARAGGGAAVPPQPAGPVAGRGPARGQRHRLPGPVRPVLRRGGPRLRRSRRRAGQQRPDPVHPRADASRGRGARPGRPRSTAWSIMGRTVPTRGRAASPRRGMPIVLLARAPLVGGLDTVTADSDASARRELADHLLGHGSRAVRLLGDPADSLRRDRALRRRSRGARVAARRPRVRRAPVRCAFDAQAGHGGRRGRSTATPRPRRLGLRQRRGRPRGADARRGAGLPSPTTSWSPAGTT